MAACFAGSMHGGRVRAMASLAAHRSRRGGRRLFEGPVVFRRRRMKVAELVALVWLLVKIARLAREAPGRSGAMR